MSGQRRRSHHEDPHYRPPHPAFPYSLGPIPAQGVPGPSGQYVPYTHQAPPFPPPPHFAPPPHGYSGQIDPSLLHEGPSTPLVALAELPGDGPSNEAETTEDPFQDDRGEGESSDGGGSEDEYYNPGEMSSEEERPVRPQRSPSAERLELPPLETPAKGRGSKGKQKEKEKVPPKRRGRPKKNAAPVGAGEGDEAEEDGGEEDGAVLSRLAGFVSNRNAPGQSKTAAANTRELFNDEIESVVIEDRPAKGRGKGKSRRAKKVHEGNFEVRQLLGEANLDFMSGHFEPAIEKFLEIIRQDPQVYAAWASLATCYDELENPQAALQMRFCAAHLDGDEEIWRDLAAAFKLQKENTQALYCLQKAIRSDPNDVMMLLDMVELNRDLGKASRAVELVKKIIKIDSAAARNFLFLADTYALFKSTNQSAFFSQVLRAAFDYHNEVFPGHTGDPSNTMQTEHVLLLVDMLLANERLEEALMVVRRGQRWLQGRKEERTWDAYDDDREYDPPGTARLENEGEEEPEEGEGHPLDFALRHRLAMIRLRLGNDSEAAIHIEDILQLDVIQHSPLFLALADELFQRKLWDQALNCYAAVQECDQIQDDPMVIYHIGICHHQTKDLAQAVEALRWVAENDPGNLEARLRLATVLEEQGHKAEALEIVSAVLRDRAKDPSSGGRRARRSSISTTEGGSRQTKAEVAASRRLQKKVLEDQMLAKMQGLWAEAEAAERGIGEDDPTALERFIYAAGTMIETFRLAKGNFRKDRGVTRIPVGKTKKARKHDIDDEAAELHDRLERVMGIEDDTPLDDEGERYITVRQNQFYEIGTEDWLTLIIKYCCVLMVKNDEDVAMDILEHVVWAGLFNNRRSEVAIRLTTVACAMKMRLYDRIIDNCKRLVQMHQFRIEPVLLMNAALASGGSRAQKQYQGRTLQRFIHRELRIFDQAVRGIRLRWNEQNMRYNEVTKVGWSRKLGDVSSDEGDGDGDEGDEEGSVAPSAVGKRKSKGGRGKSKDRREELDEEDEEEEDDGRYGPTRDLDDGAGGAKEDVQPLPKPSKESPNFNAVYGQLMLTNGAYQTALVYYLRAYEVDPYNPLICLGIAQGFFGRSFNRQVDNRNYMIAQGLAFLSRYRKLSPKHPEAVEEVEYNYGRAFHGIGVPHLAISHYERVLDSVQARMAISPSPSDASRGSLAFEAAHNLMLLYAASGNTKLVKVKSAWLSI